MINTIKNTLYKSRPIRKFHQSIRIFTNSELNGYFRKYPVAVFHHMPKCGGSSINDVLANWFYLVNDYRPGIKLTPRSEFYLENKIDLKRLNAKYCLCSHFEWDGNYLHQRYPKILEEKRKYMIFTFIRDPLQLMISLYYFERKRGGNINVTLEEHLLNREPNYIANRIPCNESNYLEALDRYFFIGVTEKLQYSLDLLANRLNKKALKVPRVNRTKRDEQEHKLSKGTIERFKERNQLDYKIYNYALSNL